MTDITRSAQQTQVTEELERPRPAGQATCRGVRRLGTHLSCQQASDPSVQPRPPPHRPRVCPVHQLSWRQAAFCTAPPSKSSSHPLLINSTGQTFSEWRCKELKVKTRSVFPTQDKPRREDAHPERVQLFILLNKPIVGSQDLLTEQSDNLRHRPETDGCFLDLGCG